MKFSNGHKDLLRKEFEVMKDLEDFAVLLNKVIQVYSAQWKAASEGFLKREFLRYSKTGEDLVRTSQVVYTITSKDLLGYALPDAKRKTAKYVSFEIPKKSGKTRTIHAPVVKLKFIQKAINILLNAVFQSNKAATGFVARKSIVDNALLHTGQKFVFNIDLEDFFPSIDQARIWKRLHFPPFNLKPSTPRRQIADVIAGVCCFTLPESSSREQYGENLTEIPETQSSRKKPRNVLPQGAPTSPTITNIICERLDRKLTGLAKRYKLQYSRYADDITFSSDHYVYSKKGDFRTQLRAIIEEQGFRINEAKTRLQTSGYRQEVTGLTVNKRPNVPQHYIKQLRRWLHIWEARGYDAAQAIFSQEYMDPLKGRGYAKLALGPQLYNVLDGKLMFLKMVKGSDNATYLKLRERQKMLIAKDALALEAGVLSKRLRYEATIIYQQENLTQTHLEEARKLEKLSKLLSANPLSAEVHQQVQTTIGEKGFSVGNNALSIEKKLAEIEEAITATKVVVSTKEVGNVEIDLLESAKGKALKEIAEKPEQERLAENQLLSEKAIKGPVLSEANPKLFEILDKLAHEGIDAAMKFFNKERPTYGNES